MTRRAPGEGSLFRRDDGLWVARLTIDGRRIQKTGKRQNDVKRWLYETRARRGDGMQINAGKTSLSAFLAYWLDISASRLRPKTVALYEQLIRDHINPVLGNIPLNRLRPDHIERAYANATSSPYTIRKAHIVLHAALEKAVRWDILGRNPADAVTRPRLPASEMQILTPTQVTRLLAAAQGRRVEILIRLAVVTGARLGELLGLFWSDVDFNGGALVIRRQLQRLPRGGGLVFLDPKTTGSARRIPLDAETLRMLQEHRSDINAHRILTGCQADYDLVFPSRRGTPLEPRRAYTEFQAILELAGLPRVSFHALRHTCATLLISAGANVKTVSQRLGHSTVATTLRVYTHPGDEDHTYVAEMIAAILTGTK